MRGRLSWLLAGVVVCACGSQSKFNQDGGSDAMAFGDGPTFGDVTSPDGEGGPPVDPCVVPPDGTSVNAPVCTQPAAPPKSFDPVLRWSWKETPPTGLNHYEGSMVTPIVANFTDTNGDGKINLCDVPNVIVTTGGGPVHAQGTIYMLAGDTGKLVTTFDLPNDIDGSVTPALGDIDGDGIPEVLANTTEGHLVAFDNKGKVKWQNTTVGAYYNVLASYCHAIAIHDLDGDGSPEIIVAFEVYDNKGNLKFGYDESSFSGHYWCPANTAVDLDGDGKMEVIFGNAAFHSNGTKYWSIPGPPGQPHFASFGATKAVQLFIAREDGILILSHDGQILSGPTQLYDQGTSPNCWSKPGVINDFVGSGHAQIGNGSCAHMSAYKVDPTTSQLSIEWIQPVHDPSGLASSTAFDFLGQGTAEGIYGDQKNLWAFDGVSGTAQMSPARDSGTLIEYPIVVDAANDGSSQVIVVSNTNGDGTYVNTIDSWEDSSKRWIPTRRIWNQHAYYVTNVREDGTIPPHPIANWLNLNTFRSNAEVNNGQNCAPPPPNPN